jgi:hypothetical protein
MDVISFVVGAVSVVGLVLFVKTWRSLHTVKIYGRFAND